MQLRILGQVRIVDDTGAEVALRPQLRRLAAMLAVVDGATLSTDQIAERLTGGRVESSAVRTAVSRLRAVMGPRLETTPAGYRLLLADDELDARQFDVLRTRAVDGDSDGAVGPLTEALALWRGDALADFADEPWASAPAARLDHAHSAVLEELAEAMIDRNLLNEAVELLERHRAPESYRERPVALLMSALAASGRTTEALRAYQRFRTVLRDDIGIDPSQELRELEQRLLADSGSTTRLPPATDGHRVPGNLTAPAGALIGRRSDAARVVAQLDSARLVTLTGVGGVGKSRLATDVGWANRAKFPDGAWLVELAPVSDAAAVVHVIAGTLGARSEPGAGRLDAVVAELANRRMLVIIDNCEHVRIVAGEVVAELISRCPHLAILATSREPLRLAGEQVVPVMPLDDVDGAELFCTRAAEVDDGFVADTTARHAIGEICHRLDGVPLAIELAAARSRTLAPAELLARLEDSFRLLHAGPERVERHRTMDAAIDWSVQSLTDEERLVWQRLSVFAGGFDLTAVETVCVFGSLDDDAAIVDLLGSLIDKSMVVVDRRTSSTRYRMLETLREHAHRRLHGMVDEDEEAVTTLHDRHCAYFAQVAHRLFGLNRGQHFGEATSLLEMEWDNMRAAVAWSVEEGHPLRAAAIIRDLESGMETFRVEHAQWVRIVRPLVPVDDPIAGWLCCIDVQWSLVLGNPAEAIELANAGLATDFGGQFDSRRFLLSRIAEAEVMCGRPERGYAAARQTLNCDPGDPLLGLYLGAACRAAWVADPAAVAGYAERLGEVATRSGRWDDRARASHAAGIASLVDDDPRQALSRFRQGLQEAQGIVGLMGEALQAIAAATALLGGPDVEHAFVDALTFLSDNSNWMYTWTALEQLAIHWATVGEDDAAAVLLGHLRAHGRGDGVARDARRWADGVVDARPELLAAVTAGERMTSTEIVDFALDQLGRH